MSIFGMCLNNKNMEESIIERIKKLLEVEGLNETSFAKAINMNQRTVNNYFNGNRKPSIEFICKISSAFGLNHGWLLTGIGNKQTAQDETIESRRDVDYREKYVNTIEEINEVRKELNEARKEISSLKDEIIKRGKPTADGAYAVLADMIM